MKSQRLSHPTGRLSQAVAVMLSLAVTVTFFPGCTNLDTLNQFEKEWDQKHAPGTGIVGSRIVEAVVVLATYEATLEQRRMAEQRGREAHARMLREKQAYEARQARAAEAARRKSIAARSAAPAPDKKTAAAAPKPKIEPEPEPAPEPVAAPAPSLAEIIAVEVRHEGKKGAVAVMLYNTATESLVDNTVRDLSRTPSLGSNLDLMRGATVQYQGRGR